MNTNNILDHACELCGGAALKEFLDYAPLPRVTSDSKPFPPGGRLTVCGECGAVQKLVEPRWLEEIDKIYGEFDIYHQAGGAEQPIFDIGGTGGRPRSARLMDYLVDELALPEKGNILDFGCGNGAALASFGKRRPGWELFGSELSDATLPSLNRIPNFKRLYTGPLDQISEKFDLIILIHALEHVIDPVKILASLAGLLREGGSLFVEVPNVERTPYDLLVADHMTHFTMQSLGYAAARAGFRTIVLSDAVLPKELSWLGQPAPEGIVAAKPQPDLGLSLVEWHLNWIVRQAEQACSLAAAHTSFGIFGTSISATWLFNLLQGAPSFFVDEDRMRVGRQHMGRPILGPEQVPQGGVVFVPLIPEVAAAVARRLRRDGVEYHTPNETA
jgi:2-polyprenyl-3-methyl-5-hydroxy-6-metoxy-1,4-benzoquinol methylase